MEKVPLASVVALARLAEPSHWKLLVGGLGLPLLTEHSSIWSAVWAGNPDPATVTAWLFVRPLEGVTVAAGVPDAWAG